jgi:hypothetical protein
MTKIYNLNDPEQEKELHAKSDAPEQKKELDARVFLPESETPLQRIVLTPLAYFAMSTLPQYVFVDFLTDDECRRYGVKDDHVKLVSELDDSIERQPRLSDTYYKQHEWGKWVVFKLYKPTRGESFILAQAYHPVVRVRARGK